ncbi:hypothetical protein ACP3VW_02955 [Vibrio sp. DNB22_17_1]
MDRCGQCKQFTRTRENEKDLCGAWDQPTLATRQACEFFIPKKPARNKIALNGEYKKVFCF